MIEFLALAIGYGLLGGFIGRLIARVVIARQIEREGVE